MSKKTKKAMSMLLVVTLIAVIAVGGMLAYLTDRDSEANVFTVGNVDIDLTEDFTQGSELIPGKDVTKDVKVENTGKNDAWVWVTVAVPATLADDAMNIVKNDSAWDWNTVSAVTKDGYVVYTGLHNEALAPKAVTVSAMTKVGLSSAMDIAPNGDWYIVNGGQTSKVEWNNANGNPVVYVSAYAIQKENFTTAKDAYDAYQSQWGENGVESGAVPTLVANADELAAAVAKGGVIALTDDIAVDADNTMTVASGKDVTLNLNGNKLSGVADGTGNREMFLVKGNMTVVDGDIEMKATVDQDWNAMGAVFDVTAGGVLNLKGVDVDVSGTDMTFCVHLNNWGEVTLNAEDCTLKANYVPVRVFNSGYDMNNVTIKNCTLDGVSAAFWVHNYTAADFGASYNKDAVEGRLNIDLFNGTNTLKSDDNRAGHVRYGMSNSINFDEFGKQL